MSGKSPEAKNDPDTGRGSAAQHLLDLLPQLRNVVATATW